MANPTFEERMDDISAVLTATTPLAARMGFERMARALIVVLTSAVTDNPASDTSARRLSDLLRSEAEALDRWISEGRLREGACRTFMAEALAIEFAECGLIAARDGGVADGPRNH